MDTPSLKHIFWYVSISNDLLYNLTGIFGFCFNLYYKTYFCDIFLINKDLQYNFDDIFEIFKICLIINIDLISEYVYVCISHIESWDSFVHIYNILELYFKIYGRLKINERYFQNLLHIFKIFYDFGVVC